MYEPAPGYDSAENLEDKLTPSSTVTVVQTVGFLWIMFDLKFLVAYFLMTTAADRAVFRSLSNQEASALQGVRV